MSQRYLRSHSPSTERHAAGAVIGPCKNFHSLAGKLPNLEANDPIFCAASSSMRRLGAPIDSPFRPNGVTIRNQGTKAPVKTLEAGDRRSPLTTWRMSRIAKGSYCRARCSHKQALAQTEVSGSVQNCQSCRKRESCGGGRRQCWRSLTRTRLHYAQPH